MLFVICLVPIYKYYTLTLSQAIVDREDADLHYIPGDFGPDDF